MTPNPPPAPARRPDAPAWIVILGGVCAALHIGKLPPAIVAVQQALGMTLVEAGFLLSLLQLAGMAAGVAFGVVADGLGPKRSMVIGLTVLAASSAAGGLVSDVPMLMLLRATEGLGFLLTVLPAPGLIRRLVAPQRVSLLLGLWGAYMPLATASALLIGPPWVDALGWRAWWLALAAVSAAMALVLARTVPAVAAAVPAGASPAWSMRLAQTLAAPGPWWVALCFAMYSGQWLAVIGFLPVLSAAAGVSPAGTGALTALAAAVNMAGNIVAGRRLHRGTAPTRLLAIGFAVMGLAAAAAFAGPADSGLPPALRYAAVLAFSGFGGVIPATLFALAMRVAPGEATLSTTIGWIQQWSAFGQFASPPLVAWVTSRSGGWHWTWVVTGLCSVAGLWLTGRIAGWLRRHA